MLSLLSREKNHHWQKLKSSSNLWCQDLIDYLQFSYCCWAVDCSLTLETQLFLCRLEKNHWNASMCSTTEFDAREGGWCGVRVQSERECTHYTLHCALSLSLILLFWGRVSSIVWAPALSSLEGLLFSSAFVAFATWENHAEVIDKWRTAMAHKLHKVGGWCVVETSKWK